MQLKCNTPWIAFVYSEKGEFSSVLPILELNKERLDIIIAFIYRLLPGRCTSNWVGCDDASHSPLESGRDLFDSSVGLIWLLNPRLSSVLYDVALNAPCFAGLKKIQSKY